MLDAFTGALATQTLAAATTMAVAQAAGGRNWGAGLKLLQRGGMWDHASDQALLRAMLKHGICMLPDLRSKDGPALVADVLAAEVRVAAAGAAAVAAA